MPEMDGFAFLEEFEKLDKKTVANHDLHAFLNIRSNDKKSKEQRSRKMLLSKRYPLKNFHHY
jgi:hypothetical protein